MRKFLYRVPVCLLAVTASAHAQSPALAPLPNSTTASPFEAVAIHHDIDVREDGTFVHGTETAYRVLTQQGIAALQESAFSFTRGYQDLQIVTAYTLKADGTRIDVPENRMLFGHGATSLPGFQDENTLQLFFPNVAVGDQVVLRTIETQTIPWYEGEFAERVNFWRSIAMHDASLRISAPAGMNLQIDSAGMEGGEPERQGDKNVWTWRFSNDTPINFASDSVAELHADPHVAVTTFADYAEVAAAYGVHSRDKSAVTPEIQALADELTQGIADEREQVRALYNWVATNISYVAIFLGAGGFTPHEAHEVLSNRYGDCKDHVVLLEALLAAKGIESTAALIQLGSEYALSDAPSPFYFNHVITYVPSLDLYLDSTTPLAPFGTLPSSDTGKPVVHIATGERATTPSATPEETRVRAETTLEIQADGSVVGRTMMSASGTSEVGLRGLIDAIPPEQEGEHFSAMLGAGTVATLERGNPRDLHQPYSYALSYTLPNALFLPGPGAVPPQIFYKPFSFTDVIGGPFPEVRYSDYYCFSGAFEEDATVVFPDGISVLALPQSQDLSTDGVSLTMSYAQIDPRTIRKTTSLVIDLPETICTPEYYARVRADLAAMIASLRAQVIYQ